MIHCILPEERAFDSNACLSSAINADMRPTFKNASWDVVVSASSSPLISTDDLTNAPLLCSSDLVPSSL